MIIKYEKEKETKNTIRFKELSDTPRIPTLYIQKSALEEIGWSEGEKLEIEIRKEK